MNRRERSVTSLGKPPVNLLLFAIGAFAVGILVLLMGISLFLHGGTENRVFGVLGFIGAAGAFFIAVVTLLVWIRLRNPEP
jgi:hypothetical protein